MKQKKKKSKAKKTHNERIIKGRIIRDIRTDFEQQQEEVYYERIRVSNFWNNNYIEYKSNGGKNRNLLLDKCPDKMKPYLRNIIINIQNFDAWKSQLTIAINFLSSKGAEEERGMHSVSDNIKFTPYGDAKEVADELFESLCSKYQVNLETSITDSDFIFDSVQLMHWKCYRVNFIRGGSFIDSPD